MTNFTHKELQEMIDGGNDFARAIATQCLAAEEKLQVVGKLQRYTITAGFTGQGYVSQTVRNDDKGAYVSAIDLHAILKDQGDDPRN